MGIYSLETRAYFSKAEQIRQKAAMDSVTKDLAEFFSQVDLIPYGHCYLWKPALIWTHVTADAVIGISCVSVFLILCSFIRKIEDVNINTGLLFFSFFIGATGLDYFSNIWNIWNADHWWQGFFKVIIAIASVICGVYLFLTRDYFLKFASKASPSNQRDDIHCLIQASYESTLLPMGICEIEDKEIRHLSGNKEAARFFGSTPEKMSGRPMSELGVSAEISEDWGKNFNEAKASHSSKTFECFYERKGEKQKISVAVTFIGTSKKGLPQFSYVIRG